jgi:hypothetical protein
MRSDPVGRGPKLISYIFRKKLLKKTEVGNTVCFAGLKRACLPGSRRFLQPEIPPMLAVTVANWTQSWSVIRTEGDNFQHILKPSSVHIYQSIYSKSADYYMV